MTITRDVVVLCRSVMQVGELGQHSAKRNVQFETVSSDYVFLSDPCPV